jgi:molybdate transport system substrate-binding protein
MAPPLSTGTRTPVTSARYSAIRHRKSLTKFQICLARFWIEGPIPSSRGRGSELAPDPIRGALGSRRSNDFCATFFSAASAMAAEIKLLASANSGMRSALVELVPDFEGSTGNKVNMDFASVNPMKRRIDAGETFDILIASPVLIDELIKQGKVAADTRVMVARTGLGMGMPKGTPKPDISSVDAFKRTLLNPKSVGYSPDTEPGILFLEILDHLGIAQDMRPRLKASQPSETLAAMLEKHEVELVVSAITNLATVLDNVVEFPPEIQRYLDFVGGVSATTKEPEAARALLRFLVSPTATSVFKAKGFERD